MEGEAQDGQQHGRALVRQVLLEPLTQGGMQRPRGMSVADHDRMLARLADKLAYLDRDKLAGLAALIIRLSEGKQGGHWPTEVQVLKWAWAMLPPPPSAHTYAQSLIRSAMGRRAMDEGWVVELYRAALKFGPPPQKYVIGQLQDEASDNQRRRQRVREWIEAGRATADERGWLSAWHRDMQECEALLASARGEDGVAA